MPADNPLLGLDNVVLTPHVTWYTADTMRRYLDTRVDNCRRLHAGGPGNLVNEVNQVVVGPNRPVNRERPTTRCSYAHRDHFLSTTTWPIRSRSLVARVAPSEVLHEALETPIPNPPPYWKAAAEQGLQGLHLSEIVGGQGFGILELAIVLAEFGYGAVPGPFVPSAIASALIAANDPDDKLLERPGLRRGHRRLRDRLRTDRHPPGRRPGHPRRGARRARRGAGVACWCCRSPSTAAKSGWCSTPTRWRSSPSQSVDPLRPLAHVRANAVEVGDDRVLTNLSRTLARALMSTLLSAECIGVARWATDTAVGVRQDPRAVRQARSASSRPSSTSAPR